MKNKEQEVLNKLYRYDASELEDAVIVLQFNGKEFLLDSFAVGWHDLPERLDSFAVMKNEQYRMLDSEIRFLNLNEELSTQDATTLKKIKV